MKKVKYIFLYSFGEITSNTHVYVYIHICIYNIIRIGDYMKINIHIDLPIANAQRVFNAKGE